VAIVNFRLEYDLRDLERSRSGAIWGSIWIILGDEAFPEEHWNDMSVALLNEFARAVYQLKPDLPEVARFFDGPFSVTFRKTAPGLVEVSLDGSNIRSSIRGTVDNDELLMAVQNAVADMYRACTESGWSEDQNVKRLRAFALRA
jgi:hypothetical protein